MKLMTAQTMRLAHTAATAGLCPQTWSVRIDAAVVGSAAHVSIREPETEERAP